MKMLLALGAALAMVGAPDEDLDKAAAKAAAMGNYSCTITVKMEGMGGGGGGGEGRGIQPVELQIKADAPWHVKSGEVEAYKKGETLAVKDGETWKKLERPQRPADGERPDRKAMAAQMLRGVRGPHETLKDLNSASFKEVKREDSEGGRCYSGELTAEAVKAIAQRGRRGGGGGGGDRPQAQSTGTAKLWVNGDGAVTKYEVYIESKMKNRDDEEVTFKRTTTVDIRDIGSTKYDVPEGAAKALEAKAEPK
jgi:hypothetical protein